MTTFLYALYEFFEDVGKFGDELLNKDIRSLIAVFFA